jgi:hypothetical protein
MADAARTHLDLLHGSLLGISQVLARASARNATYAELSQVSVNCWLFYIADRRSKAMQSISGLWSRLVNSQAHVQAQAQIQILLDLKRQTAQAQESEEDDSEREPTPPPVAKKPRGGKSGPTRGKRGGGGGVSRASAGKKRKNIDNAINVDDSDNEQDSSAPMKATARLPGKKSSATVESDDEDHAQDKHAGKTAATKTPAKKSLPATKKAASTSKEDSGTSKIQSANTSQATLIEPIASGSKSSPTIGGPKPITTERMLVKKGLLTVIMHVTQRARDVGGLQSDDLAEFMSEIVQGK